MVTIALPFNFYSHTFEYLLQCSEERINPGKLLGKSRRLKYHTRFQNTIGWWSTKSATVIAWSPSFSNKLSSSFHTTKGLRYGTVTGSGLWRRHSNPKDSCWINKNRKWQIQDWWYGHWKKNSCPWFPHKWKGTIIVSWDKRLFLTIIKLKPIQLFRTRETKSYVNYQCLNF